MTSHRHRLSFALLLTLTLLAGASAGLVATVILDTSLDDYADALLAGRHPATPDGERPRSTPNSIGEALERVQSVSVPSVVTITATSLDARTSASWIAASDALGYGVVVSTDGWVLARASTFSGVGNPLRGTELWIDGTRYTPTQYVADTLTDFVMVKVAATGLVPVAFASSELVGAGEPVFLVYGADTLTSTSVASIAGGATTDPLPAEEFDAAWALTTTPSHAVPVFSWGGDLYAMAGSDVALPMHEGISFVREVMRAGAPSHAALGAYVVEISRPLNIDATMREGQEYGALVTGVLTGGPGAAAGLATGDVLVAVDDVRVDGATSLAELLRLYDPGQAATLRVVRDGQEQTLTVTLGDYDDLLY